MIISGSGATYSGTQQYFNIMGGVGTNFQGFNFGTFNPSAGQTLVLNGFEVNTFQNSGDDIQSAFGDYRIREKGTTFTETSLGFRNVTNGDKKWDVTNLNVNLLAGLSNGTYTFDIYTRAHGVNNGFSFDLYDNNGGANYTATFTVVPEPSTWAAGILAFSALGFAQRRRFARLLQPA